MPTKHQAAPVCLRATIVTLTLATASGALAAPTIRWACGSTITAGAPLKSTVRQRPVRAFVWVKNAADTRGLRTADHRRCQARRTPRRPRGLDILARGQEALQRGDYAASRWTAEGDGLCGDEAVLQDHVRTRAADDLTRSDAAAKAGEGRPSKRPPRLLPPQDEPIPDSNCAVTTASHAGRRISRSESRGAAPPSPKVPPAPPPRQRRTRAAKRSRRRQQKAPRRRDRGYQR